MRSFFDEMDRKGGYWYKDYNNESGYLAFREAHILQAYLIMFETYRDTCYLDKFVSHADSVLKQRDSLRQVTDYRGLSLPAWRRTEPPEKTNLLILGGKFYHVPIETGSISYPYAWFARLVQTDAALSSYKDKAKEYLQAAKDAVEVHDDEWREAEDETGYYIFRKGSPYWCDGVGVPFNQNLSLARTMLLIYQATGETKYIDRVVKIARHFQNHLNLHNDCYIWNYWWGHGYNGWESDHMISDNTPSYKGYKKPEDLSHGAIDADFVYLACQAGIVFTGEDLRRFASTLEKNLIGPDNTIYEFVTGPPLLANGSRRLLIGCWLRYHSLAPKLYEVTYKQLTGFSSLGAVGLLVLAYLNRAAHNHGENSGCIPDSGVIRDIIIVETEDDTRD